VSPIHIVVDQNDSCSKSAPGETFFVRGGFAMAGRKPNAGEATVSQIQTCLRDWLAFKGSRDLTVHFFTCTVCFCFFNR